MRGSARMDGRRKMSNTRSQRVPKRTDEIVWRRRGTSVRNWTVPVNWTGPVMLGNPSLLGGREATKPTRDVKKET